MRTDSGTTIPTATRDVDAPRDGHAPNWLRAPHSAVLRSKAQARSGVGSDDAW